MKKSESEKKRIRISRIKAVGTWLIVMVLFMCLDDKPGVPWYITFLLRLCVGFFAMQAAWTPIFERRYDELFEEYQAQTTDLLKVCEDQNQLICELQGVDPAQVEIAAMMHIIEDEEAEKEADKKA